MKKVPSIGSVGNPSKGDGEANKGELNGKVVELKPGDRVRRVEVYLKKELNGREQDVFSRWSEFSDHYSAFKAKESPNIRGAHLIKLISGIWDYVYSANLRQKHRALMWLIFDLFHEMKSKHWEYYQACFIMGGLAMRQGNNEKAVELFEIYIGMVDPNLNLEERKEKVLRYVSECYARQLHLPKVLEGFAKKHDPEYAKGKYIDLGKRLECFPLK